MKDLNILIRDLPLEVNDALRIIAALKGVSKWRIIREALIEYADRHRPTSTGERRRIARQ